MLSALLTTLYFGSIGDAVCSGAGGCDGNLGTIAQFFRNMIDGVGGLIMVIIGSLAVLVVAYGGILMMTSTGNPAGVKKGKDCILWGIIGLVVAIYARMIIDWVWTGANGGFAQVGQDINSTISMILKLIFGVLGLLAVGVLIYGGITMMTSTGNPASIKKGKDCIIWGLIGLIICLFSFTIVEFILSRAAAA